jgi:hypothetical protein
MVGKRMVYDLLAREAAAARLVGGVPSGLDVAT